jgi:aspartate racemase
MKMIGLIGGMSWESTVVYYQLLNRLARQRLGGLHSARLLLWSFDFAEIEAHQAAGDWEAATNCMLDAARSLEKGGAECIVICTNTMHKMAKDVQDAVDVPLIHIADATAAAIKAAGARKPLLLGTRFTMEQDFYKGHLENKHGINVLVPNAEERTSIHEIIYQELCQGEIRSVSKQRYLEIVSNAINAGADGVIFGCTEVGLLIAQDDLDVPAFDTTVLHANAAMDYALS